jgi:hypothetical protein
MLKIKKNSVKALSLSLLLSISASSNYTYGSIFSSRPAVHEQCVSLDKEDVVTSTPPVAAEEVKYAQVHVALDAQDMEDAKEQPIIKIDDSSCCKLQIDSVCTHTLKAECASATNLRAQNTCTANLFSKKAYIKDLQVADFCADKVSHQIVCANKVTTAELCADSAYIKSACVDKQRVGTICADTISVKNLCVSGVSNASQAHNSRGARIGLKSDSSYQLGDTIPFDDIRYDAMRSIVQEPSSFLTPESGNYIATIQVNIKDLQGFNIIAGTPIAALEVYVNDVLRRQVFSPYLSFNRSQSSLLTSLLYLDKGERLTVRYRVFVMDPEEGFKPYDGQVVLLGRPEGSSAGTFMSIQYLSSESNTSNVSCAPCDVQCAPCTITSCPSAVVPCQPIDIVECVACDSNCEPCVRI